MEPTNNYRLDITSAWRKFSYGFENSEDDYVFVFYIMETDDKLKKKEFRIIIDFHKYLK